MDGEADRLGFPTRDRSVGSGLQTTTHAAGAGAGRRWWVLAAALTVQSTISVIGQGLPALVPFVKADLGLNHAQAGVFATITGLGTFLALFAVGWAVDRAGDRAVLVGGGVLTGLLTVAAAFAPGYPLLLLLLVLVGIGVATPTPAGSTAVMREFPIRQRGVVMSVRQTGIPLGGAVAAVTLAPLAALWGWRTALIAGGVAALAGALAGHLCYVRAGGGEPEPRTGGRRWQGTPALLSRDLVLTSACGFLLIVAQFCLVSYLVLYVRAIWAVPVVVGSLLLAGTQVCGAVGRILWGWVSDRLLGGSRKWALVVVTGTAALAGLLLAWLPAGASLGLVVLVVAICGLSTVGWNGIYITLLAELGPPGFQARSVGLGMTLGQPGIVLGPWLFGVLVDRTGSFRLGWTVVACGLFVALLAIGLVRERRPAAPQAGRAG